MSKQIILIGAGQASASAARTLRRTGFDGDIVLVGDEAHAPYQRPYLSKEYFRRQCGLDEIWAAPDQWYSENNITMELGTRALEIDRKTLSVNLSNGRSLQADAILIATGGRARRFAGADRGVVMYLRNIEDADRLREYAHPGSHVILVGGGFIGSEIAASARVMGANVTIIETMGTLLGRVLGDEVGAVCTMIHTENGVDVRCGSSVESIQESGSRVVVRTSDGSRIEGDVVVAGIGMEPVVDLAKASELMVGNGIRVDEFCRTSAERIYAAGDVANHYHPLFDRRMRVEHFDNATRQGAVAAKNMMGIPTRYTDPHWFWSDQYGHSLQYVGHADRWDRIVFRGSVEDRNFVAFYLLDGRIQGAFGLNRGGEIMAVKSILSAAVKVAPERLQDEDLDLGDLANANGEEKIALTSGTESAAQSNAVFERVARSGQVPEGIVRRFVVAGVEIAVARLRGKAYAVHNLCTHLACHLASGKVENDGLTCFCHGSVFDLSTGEPINPPATRAVKTYALKESDGQIYVSVK